MEWRVIATVVAILAVGIPMFIARWKRYRFHARKEQELLAEMNVQHNDLFDEIQEGMEVLSAELDEQIEETGHPYRKLADGAPDPEAEDNQNWPWPKDEVIMPPELTEEEQIIIILNGLTWEKKEERSTRHNSEDRAVYMARYKGKPVWCTIHSVIFGEDQLGVSGPSLGSLRPNIRLQLKERREAAAAAESKRRAEKKDAARKSFLS